MTASAALAALIILSGKSVVASEFPSARVENEGKFSGSKGAEYVFREYIDSNEQRQGAGLDQFHFWYVDEARFYSPALENLAAIDGGINNEVYEFVLPRQRSWPRHRGLNAYMHRVQNDDPDSTISQGQVYMRKLKPVRRINQLYRINSDAGLICREQAFFRDDGGLEGGVSALARGLISPDQEADLEHGHNSQESSEPLKPESVISDPLFRRPWINVSLGAAAGLATCVVMVLAWGRK